MAGRLGILSVVIVAVLALGVSVACAANSENTAAPEAITVGTQTQRGFVNDKMIVLSTQLNDWGETSAHQAIALTEYFLAHYNIDPSRVYLHGNSGGGETGSLVMRLRPELYAGYLMTSSQWDGDLSVLAEARTPVYLATGENDSYYGSGSMKQVYQTLRELYAAQGLPEDKIRELLVLDAFTSRFGAVPTQKAAAESWLDGLAAYWK